MCFSATASFVTGSSLVVLGVATLRLAPTRAALAFAGIPLLFGIQQVVEGLVWLSLHNPPLLPGALPALVYSLFAHVLWPLYMPWAVRQFEPVPWRRRALLGSQLAGAAVGLYFLVALAQSPPSARVLGAHVVYEFAHLDLLGGIALYLLATCASSLLSSHRGIRIFGVLSLLSFAATVVISLNALVSVWCFFAAGLSLLVYWILRADLRSRDPLRNGQGDSSFLEAAQDHQA